MSQDKGESIRGAHILVVEDSLTQAEFLRHLLLGNGYRVTVAGSGEEAVEVLAGKTTDLIISDILMPGMDGYELTNYIRNNDELREIPVILLTSLTDSEDVVNGLEARIDAYLTKPYDNTYLLNTVERVLSEPRRHRGLDCLVTFDATFRGESRTITTDPQSFVDILLSTYENAAQLNTSLLKAQMELKSFNRELEKKIEERTSHLVSEITQRRKAERELRDAHEHLERRVEERTRELAHTNQELAKEIQKREQAEQQLLRAAEELEVTVAERTAELKSKNESLQLEIAERARAEEALQAREQFLSDVFASIRDGIVVLDTDLTIVRHNPTMDEWFPHLAPLDGRPCALLYGIREHEHERCPAYRTMKTGEPAQTVMARPDRTGEIVGWLEVHTFPLVESSSRQMNGVIQYVRDVTERQQAKKAVHQSRETIEALLNATTDLAFVLDSEGTFVAMNQAVATLAGTPEADLIGKSAFDYLDPPDSDIVRSTFEQVLEHNEMIRFEDKRFGQVLDNTLCPIVDVDGIIRGVVGYTRNITEFKQAQETVLQSHRILALSELAEGIAHNFNNLLQVVMGGAQLASTYLELGNMAGIKGALEEILDNGRTGAETVKRLQYLARFRPRRGPSVGKPFSLSVMVNQAIEMSRPWWKTNPDRGGIKIVLNRNLSPECIVEGDDNELFELAVNLLRNAAEDLPEGGRIDVSTFVDNGNVVLEVRDTGNGAGRMTHPVSLQPFAGSRGFQGAGFGLDRIDEIVNKHHGTFRIDRSREGMTVFTVRFPIVRTDNEKEDVSISGEFRPVLRVLAVDDNEPVARIIRDGLKTVGHEVQTAFSGRKALDIFKQSTFDVIVCDLGMPEMNGLQVSHAIDETCRERGLRRPAFILLTGWESFVEETDLHAHPIDAVLQKPADMNKLMKTIRAALDRSR